MEKESYRDILESVLEFTGGGHVLSVQSVARFAGIDPRTAKRRYPFNGTSITAEALSRSLCGGSQQRARNR